jgi:5-methyltetrahydropteroyltriglutamate--homocysteine methyltransferase
VPRQFPLEFCASGGYEPVAETLFNAINVHGYFMEYDTDRAGGFEPLRLVPKGKKVVLGLVTSKSGKLESRDEIERRIEQAAKHVALDQLCLSPQCGFASTEEGNILYGGRAMGETAHDRRNRRGRVGIAMRRAKPPFRADHVGSLLRPQALKVVRERRAKGEITAEALRAVEDREIEDIIRKQEAAGLQSISDGEFRRSWWHLDFLWGLEGVERHVMDAGIAFAAVTTRNEGVRVTGKLGFSGHPMLEHFKFLKAHTQRTPKMTIPAPSALYGRPMPAPIDKTMYPTLDKFFDDLGQTYKKAVRAFADVGCRYLQLDEVFIAMLCDQGYRQRMRDRGDDPDFLAALYGDLINTAISDIPPDMTVTMHLCRGNYKSSHMGSGISSYDAVQEVLFDRIKVHGYFMEYDSVRAGGFEPLKRLPEGRIAVLGLVTTKTGTLESRDTIKRRIEEAAKFTNLDQLCLSPQCGFASTEEGNILAEDEQWAKLRMIVEIAQEVWG